jgi:hypothetical protein
VKLGIQIPCLNERQRLPATLAGLPRRIEGILVALESWSRLRALALGVVVAVALAYSTMFSAVTAPNERSRIYLAVSLVDAGTIEITHAIDRFGKVMDIAEHDGRYYSDKAPGSSLLAALLYGTLRIFSEAEVWTIEDLLLVTRRGLMVPIGVIGFFALRLALRRVAIGRTLSDIVALGWILGSAAFHYSSALYGHQIEGVSLVCALLLSLEAEARVGVSRPLVALLSAASGACAGLADLTEYQSGIPALFLSLYVLFGPLGRSVYGAAAFAAGALPFLIGLGVYNTIAFGGPFELSYHHLFHTGLKSIHSHGVGGVTVPNLKSFQVGLLSLNRGLLPTSPMFVFLIPGIWAVFHRGHARLGVLLGAVTAFYFFFISSSSTRFAGWSFGPRLLVPAMGLMAVLVAAGAQHLSKYASAELLFRGSVIVGVAYHQLVHAFFPEPPPEAKNPLVDLVAVLFEQDLVAPNVLTASGLARGVASLQLLFAAIALVLVFVVFARMRARRLWTRGIVSVLSLCMLPSLFAYANAIGPSSPPEQRQKVVEFVSELLEQEPGARHEP